uniref:Uncharacterized protein n=1 Tax=Alexandrium andersonii TaxID=327968 RepID=A0A7S2BUF5_9DINO|mmetsp:Transcript_30293/g.68890  ORF Transcript_30293/g.68890 Transcript_30293/m.68890 type:complete len:264 (+) Transcript_30293:67-858(+)
MALRRAIVAALLGTANAVSDVSSLLQAGRVSTGVAVEFGPQFAALFSDRVDLGDEDTVRSLIKQMAGLKEDLQVVLETNDVPGSKLKASQADLAQLHNLEDKLADTFRETQMKKLPVWPVHKVAPPPSIAELRAVVSKLRANMYADGDKIAHVVSANMAFCFDGPSFYVRKMLGKFKTSPLGGGFGSLTPVTPGSCQDAGLGFTEQKQDFYQGCFKQARVYVNPEHHRGWSHFSKTFSTQWKLMHHKTDEDVMAEMQHICLKD